MNISTGSEHSDRFVLIAGALAQNSQEQTTQLTAALLLQQAAELTTLAAIAQQLEEWTVTEMLEEIPPRVWEQWTALRSYVWEELEDALGTLRDDNAATFSELLEFFLDLYS